MIDKQALSESDVPISEGSEKPRLRKGHLSPREGSLRSEGDSFTYAPAADPLRQSADLFRPTEDLARSTERPSD